MSFDRYNGASRSSKTISQRNVGSIPNILPIEPELAEGTAPRVARLTRRAIMHRCFLWSMLWATVALLCFLDARDYAMWNELLQQGIVTQAVPYDRYATYSGRNSTRSNYILYRFHADTVSRTFSRAVSQREYDTMPTREKVLVTYLPGTRGQIWEEGLASPERRNTNVAGEIIGTLIDGVVWLLCISVTSCSHTRQLHLLREGIAVPGVVRAALVFRRGKSNRYMVQYSYDAGNKEQAGEMVLPEAQYRRIAGANTHFTVLYNAAHPHEPIPYSLITDAYLIASAGGRNA